jgi:hypothetical protein
MPVFMRDSTSAYLLLQQPYWQATGALSGGLTVFVVRYRRKYYATNRLTLTAKEVRTL